MHICFLSEHFHKTPSGPRKACVKLAEALIQLGHRVSLIGIAPRTEDESWTGSRPARLRKYTWKLVPVKIGRPRFFARELHTLHKEEKIDVVLAMGLEAGSAAFRFRAKSGVPFVLNPRSYLSEAIGHPKYKLAKKLTEECNALVTLSKAARGAWYGRFGAREPDNSFGILNGCDTSEHEGDVEPLPDVNLQPNVPMILSVGMLRRPKGHHVVLRAMAELRNRPWQLVIAGEGDAREELERDVVRHGLVGRVHLPGIVEGARLRWLYRNATFFCLFPIYFEVCGNAFLEAQTAGLPIIASRAGGISEVLGSVASNRTKGLSPEHSLTFLTVPLRGQGSVDEQAAFNELAERLDHFLLLRRGDEKWNGLNSIIRDRAAELPWSLAAQEYAKAFEHAMEHTAVRLVYDQSVKLAHWRA